MMYFLENTLLSMSRRGDSTGMVMHGLLLATGLRRYHLKFGAEALNVIERANTEGVPLAALLLAYHKSANGEPQREVLRLAELAYSGGLPEAATFIGSQCKDAEEARRWYQKGAEGGDAVANFHLAHEYLNDDENEGVIITDPAAAEKLFSLAAQAGHPSSLYWLAEIQLRDGRTEEGLRNLNRSSDLDHVESLVHLSQLYTFGTFGVAQDKVLAAQFERRAELLMKKYSDIMHEEG